ncbi:hypothetical protein EMIT036CA2_60076 [Chryseobacterium sp. IT-36CA2]
MYLKYIKSLWNLFLEVFLFVFFSEKYKGTRRISILQLLKAQENQRFSATLNFKTQRIKTSKIFGKEAYKLFILFRVILLTILNFIADKILTPLIYDIYKNLVPLRFPTSYLKKIF